jgi:hypothetical protein
MNYEKEGWLFTSTNEAQAYGRYFSGNPHIIEDLKSSRNDILRDYAVEKGKTNRNMQTMMDLAVQAQFHREAIEEARKGNNP